MASFATMEVEEQDMTYKIANQKTSQGEDNALLEAQSITDIDESLKVFKEMLATDVAAKKSGWTHRANNPDWYDGMKSKIFSRKMPGRSIEMVRIDESFKGIKCKDLQDFLMMPEFANQINPSFKENFIIDEKTIDTKEDEDALGEIGVKKGADIVQNRYWRLVLPLMTDRDNTLRI